MSKAKVFGVIALKGGVGKTSVVANLGAALAKEFNKKVLLIDANFSTPHLGLHLGLVNPKNTLHHALNGKSTIHDAIYNHPLNFDIIPGALSYSQVDPLKLSKAIEPLKENYDVILIDSSPSLNDEIFATMSASDELLVVSTPDFPTLSSTVRAIKIAKKKSTPIRGIIINKAHGKKFELSSKDIAKTSEIDVLATIPDDIHVLASLAEMTPVVQTKPNREVSIMFKKLAASLVNEQYQSQKLLSKIRSALRKMVAKKAKKEVK